MKRISRTTFPGRKNDRGRSASSESSDSSSSDSSLSSSLSSSRAAKAANEGNEERTDDETEKLVRLAQKGERPALNTLFGRYRSGVVDLARKRMGSRLQAKEDPEDLAQTTFREAARDFSGYEYRGDRSFFGWLSRILQNKIRDRAEFHAAAKRDSSREVSFTRAPGKDGKEQSQFEPASTGLAGLELAELREQLELLHEHLEELSPLHREAIRLVYFEGLSLREAGERLGQRSEAAIRMLIRRAADRLKESLKRD